MPAFERARRLWGFRGFGRFGSLRGLWGLGSGLLPVDGVGFGLGACAATREAPPTTNAAGTTRIVNLRFQLIVSFTSLGLDRGLADRISKPGGMTSNGAQVRAQICLESF